MSIPIYAVGDIHGQMGMLQNALSRIEADGGPDARVVFLGDYVDRGPNSREVLDLLIEGRKAGRNWVMVKGNHDRMMVRFVQDCEIADKQLPITLNWLNPRLGGQETLASYGVEVTDNDRIFQVHERACAAVPPEHLDFINALPTYHQEGELLFVHAGIRPGIPLAQQSEDDLVWIRQEFLIESSPYPWLIVHGHTPVDTAEHCGNRVNLDAGAGYGRPLATAVFEGRQCWLLTDAGRVPLEPNPR
ncbi:metallophosphoesterase family protein [Ruegeria atlantica]|uniref:Bis(5'-nucleosyl)-tetraphosphatase PrpE [asymmetrical] n=1 Tax=Ruegeria atlantica TaxID=81569 RepID=A0A0P1E2V7_9RHOB|nr:metallophosphoesterase family protein [Ruegeria atlantica]CUH42575.1 Bis(5'-nucleosyl)-tetraphosphatase PrpE [asymmetrical] [Ruegeria atlantica]